MSIEMEMVKIKFNVFKNKDRVRIDSLDREHFHILVKMIHDNDMHCYFDKKQKKLIKL